MYERIQQEKLTSSSRKTRQEALKIIRSCGFGHVGGSVDLAELMAVLYGCVTNYDPKHPRWEERDWLVLSKGHAGPATYATYGLRAANIVAAVKKAIDRK